MIEQKAQVSGCKFTCAFLRCSKGSLRLIRVCLNSSRRAFLAFSRGLKLAITLVTRLTNAEMKITPNHQNARNEEFSLKGTDRKSQ